MAAPKLKHYLALASEQVDLAWPASLLTYSTRFSSAAVRKMVKEAPL